MSEEHEQIRSWEQLHAYATSRNQVHRQMAIDCVKKQHELFPDKVTSYDVATVTIKALTYPFDRKGRRKLHDYGRVVEHQRVSA